MKVVIKNKYGSLEIGGAEHKSARLLQIKGLGLPSKDILTVTFAGQPGYTIESKRDMTRTITMSFDFFGGQKEIERIYKMLYHDVELYFYFGECNRKISGVCINPEEVEKIMHQSWYKLILQFVCPTPYFNDFNDTRVILAKRENLWPNTYEDGNWYVELPSISTKRTYDVDINNRGDINLYPKIIITNNSEDNAENDVYGIVVENSTTGKFIELDYDSEPGEIITMDLPYRKIISNLHGDITKYISGTTVLADFYLKEGLNNLRTTNRAPLERIAVVVEYNNNYLTAVM